MKIKKYYKSNLLENEKHLLDRCALIENISEQILSIPKTFFKHYDEYLIYQQELVNKQRIQSIPRKNRYDLLQKFSKDLDLMGEYNFVHGDINFSNVLYDGESFKLIDFEPCFRQIRNKHVVIKSGLSFRSMNDYKNKTISSETDKIGFYFLCKRLLDEKMQTILGRDLFERRKNGSYEIGIKEEYFKKMKFTEILFSLS